MFIQDKNNEDNDNLNTIDHSVSNVTTSLTPEKTKICERPTIIITPSSSVNQYNSQNFKNEKQENILFSYNNNINIEMNENKDKCIFESDDENENNNINDDDDAEINISKIDKQPTIKVMNINSNQTSSLPYINNALLTNYNSEYCSNPNNYRLQNYKAIMKSKEKKKLEKEKLNHIVTASSSSITTLLSPIIQSAKDNSSKIEKNPNIPLTFDSNLKTLIISSSSTMLAPRSIPSSFVHQKTTNTNDKKIENKIEIKNDHIENLKEEKLEEKIEEKIKEKNQIKEINLKEKNIEQNKNREKINKMDQIKQGINSEIETLNQIKKKDQYENIKIDEEKQNNNKKEEEKKLKKSKKRSELKEKEKEKEKEVKSNITKRKSPTPELKEVKKSKKLFSSVIALIIPLKIPKIRRKLMINKIEKLGGKITEKYSDIVTHIIADLTYEEIIKYLKLKSIKKEIYIVKSEWISQSLKNGRLENEEIYKIWSKVELDTIKFKYFNRKDKMDDKDWMTNGPEEDDEDSQNKEFERKKEEARQKYEQFVLNVTSNPTSPKPSLPNSPSETSSVVSTPTVSLPSSPIHRQEPSATTTMINEKKMFSLSSSPQSPSCSSPSFPSSSNNKINESKRKCQNNNSEVTSSLNLLENEDPYSNETIVIESDDEEINDTNNILKDKIIDDENKQNNNNNNNNNNNSDNNGNNENNDNDNNGNNGNNGNGNNGNNDNDNNDNNGNNNSYNIKEEKKQVLMNSPKSLSKTITANNFFNSLEHTSEINESELNNNNNNNDNDNDNKSIPNIFKPRKVYNQDTYLCMRKNSKSTKTEGPNEDIIKVLNELLNYYQLIKSEWRIISYQKAISAIRRYPNKIFSYKQAKSIFGVGDGIAKKIEEIINTGSCKKLENFRNDKMNEILKIFIQIWGVGESTAQKWYSKGYRSIEDILKNENLSYQQKIGIQLYNEFKERMPREEAEEISNTVQNVIKTQYDPDLQFYTMGSFRRGLPTCGDIDIIITKNDNLDPELLYDIVKILKENGILTHDLSFSKKSSEEHSKYMGVAQLPGHKHRRIDLLIVPWNELGAALLYFTGSDVFNRSLRLLARKKGWRLNQRGLYANVLRNSDSSKITSGVLIASKTEKEIFDALEVPYREPKDRDA